MKALARRVVEARGFEPWMIGLIIFNGVLIGLEALGGSGAPRR